MAVHSISKLPIVWNQLRLGFCTMRANTCRLFTEDQASSDFAGRHHTAPMGLSGEPAHGKTCVLTGLDCMRSNVLQGVMCCLDTFGMQRMYTHFPTNANSYMLIDEFFLYVQLSNHISCGRVINPV